MAIRHAATLRGPATEHLNGVYELCAVCYLVAEHTQQLSRAEAVNTALAGTLAMKLNVREPRGKEPATNVLC